jgi:hypothetical protein
MIRVRQLYEYMKNRCPEPCNRCCGACMHLMEEAKKEEDDEMKEREYKSRHSSQ